ncbi:MAG: 30S ribosomal protein S3, partial [Thermoprotei archaeon ex4572_64]
HVLLKPGIYGIEVRVLPPIRLSDQFTIKPPTREVEVKAVETTSTSSESS